MRGWKHTYKVCISTVKLMTGTVLWGALKEFMPIIVNKVNKWIRAINS
ncbi:hypothetical protein C2W64_02406 [Brevibacillus laterosporus]|nr:hypothetical protein C2W64_02406 [Brevibacillus laterosporus]